MKKRLTSNIGLKILSVLLALVLWLVITNVDDPVKTKPFPNVQVKIQNEDVIKTPYQTYEIVEGETVSFKVAARRSILENLTASDFNVKADFSKLMTGNTVMIDVTCKKNGNEVVITDLKPKTLTIKPEELSFKDFKVNVEQKGEAMEGYYIGEKVASPNIIRVSGPKGRIEKIKQVVTEIDVNNVSKSFNKIEEPIALDEDGNVIDASKLTFSDKYIEVSLTVYKTKQVDLIVRTEGKPADGYVVTGVDYEPKTITIAGEDRLLENINSLEITEDISGGAADIEKDVNLHDALELPEGIDLVGDNLTVGVNIKISKLESKEIKIWPNDIELKNKKDGSKVDFNTIGPITVKVKGPSEETENLTRLNLKPYIDLADCTIGTYALTLNAELPSNTSIYDTPMVSIRIVP